MSAKLAEASSNMLGALVLPIFEPQAGEPVPKGIAKFCLANDGNDVAHLANLFHSIWTSQSQGDESKCSLRLLVVHPDASTLAEISDYLLQEDISHLAVVGSMENPEQLLREVYQAGVHDLHEFLFVQSLLCQRVQRDSSKFSFVQEFPQEHGMITIGRQSFDPNSAAAFLPQDVPSNLGRALTVVPEAGDEGDDLEEHLANSGAQQQPISDGDASIAATLEGFGAQGLLPRPGTCSQLLSFIDSTAITAVHLDQVPFLVRSARLDDAVALHRLQGHLPTKMLRRRMPLAEIRDIINTGEGHWQWVAEVQGTVVAAIMLEHSKSDALGGVDAALKFHLIAMHPALDERAEIFYAIANFALQCILVDGEVQELRQGNLRIDLGFGDAGPEAVLAKFQTVAHTGKSERVHYNKPDKILQVKSGRCLPSAFSGVAHREILFGSWISLDGLVSWVASQVSSGSVSLTPNRANDAELNDLSAMPANAVALGDSIDRRRSKLSLIVEEARRLTSTADFNDAGADAAAEDVLAMAMDIVRDYLVSSDLDTSTFTSATSLGDTGLDSLDMLKLANLLSEALNTALPSTILFDYPSVDALCAYILAVQGIANAMQGPSLTRRRSSAIKMAKIGSRARTYSFGRSTGNFMEGMRRVRTGSFSTASALTATGLPESGRKRPSLFSHGEMQTGPLTTYAALRTMQAVILDASSVRFPGVDNASSVHPTCIGILETDAPHVVPNSRWNVDMLSNGSTKSLPARFGSFLLEGIGNFDHGIFGINPSEAIHMDPQQRFLLECAYEVIEKSSIAVAPRKPRREFGEVTVGVFVGASYVDHMTIAMAQNGISTYTASGGSLSVLAGRVSYLFGFTGPSAVIDTACSSSLVALNAAVYSLRSGQCGTTIAGAINLMLAPSTTFMYHNAGMLALDGRCKTLDASADGYVRAEAAATNLLRVANGFESKASLADNTVVLLAVAVNQDGKSSSLTAPNGPAQQTLVKSALRAAHITSSEVFSLQLHGTGTALGDPIEVNAALTTLMPKRSEVDGPILLNAAKASFGHAEPAAGLLGLMAATFMLEDRAYNGLLHLRNINPYVSQCMGSYKAPATPILMRIAAPTPVTNVRSRSIANISGFAFQGTNAHAIMEAIYSDNGSANSVLVCKTKATVWRRRWLYSAIFPYPFGGCFKGLDSKRGIACFHSNVLDGFILASGRNVIWSVATEIAFASSKLSLVGEALLDANPCLVNGVVQSLVSFKMPTVNRLKVVANANTGIIEITSISQNYLGAELLHAQTINSRPYKDAKPRILVETLNKLRHLVKLQSTPFASCATARFQPLKPPGFGITTYLALKLTHDLEHGFQLANLALQSPGPYGVGAFKGLQYDNISTDYITAKEAMASSAGDASMSSSGNNIYYGQLELKALQRAVESQHDVGESLGESFAQEQLKYMAVWQAFQKASEKGADTPDGSCSTCLKLGLGELQQNFMEISRSMAKMQHSFANFFILLKCSAGLARVARNSRMHATLSTSLLASHNVLPLHGHGGSSMLAAALRTFGNECPGLNGSVTFNSCFSNQRTNSSKDCHKGDYFGTEISNAVQSVPRLLPVVTDSIKECSSAYFSPITWVVTGGTGALGCLGSTWLSLQGIARQIKLLGRTGRFSIAPTTLLGQLQMIVVESCDISLWEDSHTSLAFNLPIGGIIHAGGMLLDALLTKQTLIGLNSVLAPKVAGSQNITKATINSQPLQRKILFSSIASLTGPAGSAAYGGANAILDILSAALNLGGIECSAVQWGAWEEIGMVSTSHAVKQAMERSGIGLIKPSDGLAAMASYINNSNNTWRGLAVAIPFNWSKFMAVQKNGSSHIFSEFQRKNEVKTLAFPEPKCNLKATSLADLLNMTLSCIQCIQGTAVSADVPLIQAGLDSLGAIELKNNLQATFAVELPSTVAFDYPTPSAIAAFIASKLGPAGNPLTDNRPADLSNVQQVVARLVASCTGQSEESIALNSPLSLIGVDSLSAVDLRDTISAHFKVNLPGTIVFDYPTVTSISELVHSLLVTVPHALSNDGIGDSTSIIQPSRDEPVGISNILHRLPIPLTSAPDNANSMEDTSRAVPMGRWDVDSVIDQVPKRLGSRFGRFLKNIEWFDTESFGFSPLETVFIDPQQRLMLESAWEALDCIHTGNSNVGVLASISFWDYSLQADRYIGKAGEAYKATGRCFSVAAGRISYCYALKGPSISIDTACSSSLSAMHLGGRMLCERRCNVGLVTAALLTIDPSTISMLTAASMLTPDGRCKTLDSYADGYARGEACVTMTIGLCSVPDSYFIALLKGSAINQDGRSTSLTAPNGPSQQSVISLALRDAKVIPNDLKCIEMHGTGTALGDPIEVGAITTVFGSQPRTTSLIFSAAKSILGHAEPAAGGVGLQRAVTCLSTNKIDGIFHLSTLNPYVRDAVEESNASFGWMPRMHSGGFFFSSTELSPTDGVWSANIGVSGFAFQGTNAHVIVSNSNYFRPLNLAEKQIWQRRYHWFVLETYAFAERIHINGRNAFVECNLKAPKLSYLWEHCVHERPILPGTAMFEAMHSVSATFLNNNSGSCNDASLQIPLLLPASAGSKVLRASLNFGDGRVELTHNTTEIHASSYHRHVASVRVATRKKEQPCVSKLFNDSQLTLPTYLFSKFVRATGLGLIKVTSLSLEIYGAHPAVLDSSTHLGAIMDLEMHQTPKVPIALGCFKVPNKSTEPRALYTNISIFSASMSEMEALPGDIRRTTFTTACAQGADLSIIMGNLSSKSLARNTKGNAPPVEDYAHYSSEYQASIVQKSLGNSQDVSFLFQQMKLQAKCSKIHVEKIAQAALSIFTIGCGILQSILRANIDLEKDRIQVEYPKLADGPCVDRQLPPVAANSLDGLFSVTACEEVQLRLDPVAGKLSGNIYLQPNLQRQEYVGGQVPVLLNSGGALITGGLNGLGLLVAVWAASSQSTTSLTLLGRAGRLPQNESLLTGQKISVHIIGCDISSFEQMEQVQYGQEFPIKNIVHAAGVLQDNLLRNQTLIGAFNVFSPKISGAQSLTRQFWRLPLRTAQFFTTVSSSLGNPGQANYAAANSTLDAMAQSFCSAGFCVQSTQWGPWAHVGMAAKNTGHLLSRLQRNGISTLHPWQGLWTVEMLLISTLNYAIPVIMAGVFDWKLLLRDQRQHQEKFSQLLFKPQKSDSAVASALNRLPINTKESRTAHEHTEKVVQGIVAMVIGSEIGCHEPLIDAGLDSLGAVELRNSLVSNFGIEMPATLVFDYPSIHQISKFIYSRSTASNGGFVIAEGKANNEERSKHIQNQVLESVKDIIGSSFSEDQPLMEAGLDSLAAIELRNALASKFDLQLPATLAFDYPTVSEIVRLIKEKSNDMRTVSQLIMPRKASVTEPAGGSFEITTIVGTGCLYPFAQDLPMFWAITEYGTTTQSVIPLSRWDVDKWYSPEMGKIALSYCRIASFVDGLELFDSSAFHIGRVESTALDPQTRVLLHVTGDALLPLDRESLSNVGTFVGCMFTDYMNLLRVSLQLNHTGPMMTGNGAPYQSGRVAFAYGLQGPCMGIDTACSSSLVAVHAGHRAIIDGEALRAVVSGINAQLWHETTVGIAQLQALSPVGRCKSFDASADGYGRGEGYASILLSRPGASLYERALGVVLGGVVNQDGRSSSLTSPHGPSQQSLLVECLRTSKLHPNDLVNVAVHGTGTTLGDPIEVGAITAVFGGSRSQSLALTSVKSCFGHTEGAAGVTGLLFAVNAASNATLSPIMCLRAVNPYVASALDQFQSVPAFAPRQRTGIVSISSASDEVRDASGTSSFGMSGVNAHLMVSSSPAEKATDTFVATKKHSWWYQRFWPTPRSHFFFSSRVIIGVQDIILELITKNPSFSSLRDHIVNGKTMLSGTSILVGVRHAGSLLAEGSNHVIVNTSFLSPCILDQLQTSIVQLTIGLRDGVAALSSRRNTKGPSQHTSSSLSNQANFGHSRLENVERLTKWHDLVAFPSQPSNFKRSIATVLRGLPCHGFEDPSTNDASLHLSALASSPTSGIKLAALVPTSIAAAATLKDARISERFEINAANRTAESWTTVGSVQLGSTSLTEACIYYPHAENGSVLLHGLLAKRLEHLAATPSTNSLPLLYSLDLQASMPLTSSMPTQYALCEGKAPHMGVEVSVSALTRDTSPLQAIKLVEILNCNDQLHVWNLRPRMQYGCGPLLEFGMLTTYAMQNILKVAANEGIFESQPKILIGPKPVQAPELEASLFGAYFDNGVGNVLLRPYLQHSGILPPKTELSHCSSPFINAVVTGGLGGLGYLISMWLASQNKYRALNIIGRSAIFQKIISFSAFAGTVITFTQANVAFKDEMDRSLRDAYQTRHIYHTSGNLSDSILQRQSVNGFREVFAPKVDCLARLALSQDKSRLVLFSSISSLLGTSGQANYAAANGVFDAFATMQSHYGSACVSVQWGAWSSLGMASSHPALLQRLDAKGYGSLSPFIGLKALEQISTTSFAVIAANPFRWNNLLRHLENIRGFLESPATPLLPSESLPDEPNGAPRIPSKVMEAPRQPLIHKKDQVSITNILIGMVREIIDDNNHISQYTPFSELGVDSIGLVELRNQIVAQIGLASLAPTILFDYPTIAALATFIFSEVSSKEIQVGLLKQEESAENYTESIQTRIFAILKESFGVEISTLGTPFLEIGLDSISSIEFMQNIQDVFGVELPVTTVFDFPTVESLASEIEKTLRMLSPSQNDKIGRGELSNMINHVIATPKPSFGGLVISGIAESSPCANNSHAIQGMDFSSVHNFISKLDNGVDTHLPLPISKWDVDQIFSVETGNPGFSYCRFGSVLNIDQVTAFDHDLFRITRNEALMMDPHARLLLAHSLEAFNDARSRGGCQDDTQNVGTFIGCMWVNEFSDMMLAWGVSPFQTAVITGNTFPFVVGRIAYSFGWQGPCVPTDTACSSSLVAAHLAKMSLEMDQCKLATVGGVNLMLSCTTTIKICALQALSPVGRCKSFDATADGYGRGEAVIVMSMEAEAPGITEIAYLASTRVNSAGRSNGLTAPSGPAQRSLITEALRSASVAQSRLAMVAVHGTGTSLGDPIEVGALTQALGKQASEAIAYTSVKSCFGHVEGAAGLAGVLLAVGSLITNKLPPIIGLRNLNPYVQSALTFGATILPRQVIGWQPFNGSNTSPVTGTSSFGMSGINAHGLFRLGLQPGLHNTAPNTKLLDMAKNRSWLLPPVHPCVDRFTAIPRDPEVEFSCAVYTPPSAFFRDHIIHKRALMPASGFIEVVHAVAISLLSTTAHIVPFLVGNVSISAALILSPTSGPLHCKLVPSTSSVLVSSYEGTHVSASYCSVTMHKKLHGSKKNSFENRANIAFSHVIVSNSQIYPKEGISKTFASIQPTFATDFVMDPANVDASLHLGAITATSLVPCSIEAVIHSRPGESIDSHEPIHGIAGHPEVAESEPSCYRSDHYMLAPRQETVHYCGLLSKSLISKSLHEPGNYEKNNSKLLYSIDWEMNFPSDVSQLLVRGTSNESISWKLLENMRFEAFPSPTTSAVEFGASNIALLQNVGRSPSKANVVSCTEVAQANSIISALVKVAAIESPDSQWSHTIYDSHSPTIADVGPTSNSFGTFVLGHCVIKPMLSINLEINGPLLPVTISPFPRGSLGNLKAVPFEAKSLKPSEVLLNVVAVGLNFRDVLNVLGMYPGDPGPPGGDCAGIVVDVGRGVSKLQIGQAVFGQAAGSLGSIVAVHEDTMVPMPANMEFRSAASIPTVYLTALACLDAATKVDKGDRVLIHAATGGLGIAATQIATRMGALVVGTAGGVAKRNALRRMPSPTQMALDSRSTVFATECLELCLGVNVVLNSLTSPGMIAASLATLSPGGAFIEVAKRDIWSAERVAQERPDVCFSTVAVDFMPPCIVYNGLLQISTLLGSGGIMSSPIVNYTLGDALQALRQLSAARHVGKIVTSKSYSSRPPTSLGSWVIIGGTGALGLLTVRHLVTLGIQEFLIYGRSGRFSPQGDILDVHATLRVTLADAASTEELQWQNQEQAVYGILHAGGVVQDATILRQTPSIMRAAMGPKSFALKSILRQTQFLPFNIFNVFSSVASVLGSGGQSNYAAANAIVDSVAVAYRKMGAPATTVNWGAWAGAGMAANAGLERMKRLGFGAIEPMKGVAALTYILSEQTLTGARGQILASLFYWDRFARNESFFNFVKADSTQSTMQALTTGSSTNARNLELPLSLSYDVIFDQIKMAVRQIIGDDVAATSPLIDAGLDSLGAIELRNELSKTLCCALPGTLIFDYPNIQAIASFISSNISKNIGHGAHDAVIPDSSLIPSSNPIMSNKQSTCVSIVGINGRVPFHNNELYETGVTDLIREAPIDRWDVDHSSLLLNSVHRPKFLSGRFGGYVRTWAWFDSEAFSISSQEASIMDPQQRCLLEDALPLVGRGDSSALIESGTTSVAVGIAKLGEPSFWSSTTAGGNIGGGYVATGKALSAAAGRLSYTFGLKGPCVAIDTACSSSLVSLGYVHNTMTCFEHHSGKGIACGVNLPMNWETSSMFAAAGMMSIDGRCKTLDAAANGYVRSEACVVVALDVGFGDGIAILRAVATNQDGRSSTLTAPNGPSQQSVIAQAGVAGMVDLADISGIEMHGTGTALGDPIEVGALATVLDYKASIINLGTTKSRSGHAETAAGALGLMNAIQQIATGAKKQTLHLITVNPYVETVLQSCAPTFSSTRQYAPCSTRRGRAAVGLSAFAFQGTNAHALLDQGPPNVEFPNSLTPFKHNFTKQQRFWFVPMPHPSLPRIDADDSGDLIFEIDYKRPKAAYLKDHLINGRSILPGAAMFEIMHMAAQIPLHNPSGEILLNNIGIYLPLALEESVSKLKCIFCNRGNLNITSMASSMIQTHCASTAVLGGSSADLAWQSCALQMVSRSFSLLRLKQSHFTEKNRVGCPVAQIHRALDYAGSIPAAIDASMHLAATIITSTKAYVPSQLSCFSVHNEQTSAWDPWVSYEAIAGSPGTTSNIRNAASTWELGGLHSKPSLLLSTKATTPSDLPERLVYTQRMFVHCPISSKLSCRKDSKFTFDIKFGRGAHTKSTLSSFLKSTHSRRARALKVMAYGLEMLQIPNLRMAFATLPLNEDASTFALNSLLRAGDAELGVGVLDGFISSVFSSYDSSDMEMEYIGRYSTQSLPLLTNMTIQTSKLLRGDEMLTQTVSNQPTGKGDAIVTGGMGALGKLVSAWLQNKNACLPFKLTLLGRDIQRHSTTPVPGVGDHQIILMQSDISYYSDWMPVVDNQSYVYHASGTLMDAPLGKQTLSHLRSTLSPKLVSPLDLASFFLARCRVAGWVNFSSVAALFGNFGQTNYAASNGALDGISTMLAFQGIPVQSLQWGPWAGGGMATVQHGVRQRLENLGMNLIPPYTGILLLERSLSSMNPLTAMVSVVNWSKFLSKAQQIMPSYSELLLQQPIPEPIAVRGRLSPMQRPKPASNKNSSKISKQEVHGTIRSIAERIIGSAIEDQDIAFMSAGLDSVGTLEMANTLSARFDIELRLRFITTLHYPNFRNT